MASHIPVLLACCCAGLLACQAPPTSGCKEGAAPSVSSQHPDDQGLHLDVALDRDGDSTNVAVTAHVLQGLLGVDGRTVQVVSSRGHVASVSAVGGGSYRAVVETDDVKTGEYAITVTVEGTALSVMRTAVVVDEVGAAWGQPRMVEGLVNTCGWEDSLAVSPDGQWLYLEYSPVSISCFLGFNRFSVACTKAAGPWKEPARPGMFNANRVDDDGNVAHGCPVTGVDPTPIPLPPLSLFGFKRQVDGSFSAPFALGYENMCSSPFGPTIRVNANGSHTMVYAWNNTAEDGSDNDLYAVDFVPGQRTSFGTYVRRENAAHLDDAKHVLLGMDRKGNQGNPNVRADVTGKVLDVMLDDESSQEQDLYVDTPTGDFPGGGWGGRKKLPAPISKAGSAEVQPFFDGDTLLFRRENEIPSFHYKGGDLTSESSWEELGNAVALKNPASATGALMTLGEPTIARVDGKRELYFVYAVRRGDGSVDLNAGVVAER